MSMFDDVLGLGRSSVTESMTDETFEPEIESMTLEDAEMLDESTDPMDFILQVAYENEINMMRLDSAIVAEEYMYLRENGQEMVTESGKIESVIAKFKKGVQWLWQKIQSFFKTVMAKLDKAMKLDQRFLDKYEKKAAGKTGKVTGDTALLNVKGLSSEGQKIIQDIAKYSDAMFDRLTNDKNVTPDAYVNGALKAIGLRSEAEGESAKDIMKAIVKGYKGKESVAVPANAAIKSFKESKEAKSDLKKIYTENKKAINAQLKAAKKMETAAKKAKVIPTEQSKAIHGTVKGLNKLGSMMTLVNRTYVKVLNMSRSFSKAVIVAAAAKDTSGETSTSESASLIDSFEFGMTL